MHRNPSSLRFLSISIIVGVAGCPGGSDLDARQLSTLSDDELVELCTDLGAGLSAEAREGWKRRACVAEVDCLADPDAYEACAAAADDDILQCDDVPPDDAPIRGCEASAATFTACYGAFLEDTAAWAAFTCETPTTPPTRDISEIAECDDLRAACPELFEVDPQATR
jgi:hypothetical protein